IQTATFASPGKLIPVPKNQVDSGFRVGAEGGLFCASIGSFRCAVVMPPQIRSLSGLAARPSRPTGETRNGDIGCQVAAIRWWSEARTVGSPFSASRKREMIYFLRNHLRDSLCGAGWPYDNRALARE